jgi:hypothetical protein
LLRRSFLPSVDAILFQGILVYISQAVTQDTRLVKNFSPSVTMTAATKVSPREEKSTVPWLYCLVHNKKEKSAKNKPLRAPSVIFRPVSLTIFLYKVLMQHFLIP